MNIRTPRIQDLFGIFHKTPSSYIEETLINCYWLSMPTVSAPKAGRNCRIISHFTQINNILT
jgi:hypothetical protein